MVISGGNSSIHAPLREKIAFAHNLYSRWGSILLKDLYIGELLEKLRREVDSAQKTMILLGVVDICKHCEEEGGSCCGAGIENKYNPVLLLINLLLEVSLPDKRAEPRSCYFLNEKGCRLVVRHVLCVNYLCSRIKHALTPGELITLQYMEGHELNTTFLLHEAIKKSINQGNDGQQSVSGDHLFPRGFL